MEIYQSFDKRADLPDHETPPPPPLPARAIAALERAAGALARLDAGLDRHPLAGAWLYRARLEAVRRDAAADGQLIDPWHLAATIEGVRFRMSGNSLLERGLIFDAARHAFELYHWLTHPDDTQQPEIARAAAQLNDAAAARSPLVGAGFGMHAWIDGGGERAPIRAALAEYWRQHGLARLPLPLGAAASLSADRSWAPAVWITGFFEAVAAEAADGLSLLRLLERDWLAARRAVKPRRRGSYAAVAVDILAAAPLVSATSLAAALVIAPKNAARLLDGFVRLGVAVELTHRAKRRLYGLPHLAPLRDAALPPRRAFEEMRKSGWPPNHAGAALDGEADAAPPPLEPSPPLLRFDPEAPEVAAFDAWIALADRAIRRAQRAIELATR